MSASSHELAVRVGDAELHRFVAKALAGRRPTNSHLIGLQRRPYEYHSSFAIEELLAIFDDGARLPLIFKNLSADGLLPNARAVRPDVGYDPTREIAVYRHILNDESLGFAACYAGLIDSRSKRYWLLLEKVAGDELYKVGDFDAWRRVARWLANMHRTLREVASKERRVCRLAAFDEPSCNVWIERAERFLHQPHARTRIDRSEIIWLADRCRLAVRRISTLPVTFLHGEFYASNILVQQRENELRICPVDWETAAIGPGLIDLAALVAGNWLEREKQQLAKEYCEVLMACENAGSQSDEMIRDLQRCRLFLAIRWLGWSPDWQPPREHRFDWLGEAMELARALG